jgi:hypothetical protein
MGITVPPTLTSVGIIVALSRTLAGGATEVPVSPCSSKAAPAERIARAVTPAGAPVIVTVASTGPFWLMLKDGERCVASLPQSGAPLSLSPITLAKSSTETGTGISPLAQVTGMTSSTVTVDTSVGSAVTTIVGIKLSTMVNAMNSDKSRFIFIMIFSFLNMYTEPVYGIKAIVPHERTNVKQFFVNIS